MAKFCSPTPPPKLIERTDENDRGGLLGAALRAAEESGTYTKVREGYDKRYVNAAVRTMRDIGGLKWDDLTDYFVKAGWLRLDKKATKKALEQGLHDTVFKPGRLSGEQEGYVASVTKLYLEGVGEGVLQQADTFLAKVNAGEDATVEGLEFAKQMQHFSRFGGYVLGWDQSIGRGLRQQMLRNGKPKAIAVAQRNLDQVTDALGNMGEYRSKFEEIAAKLQSDTQKVDGVNELINLAKRVSFLRDPMKIAKTSMGMEIAGNAVTEVMINGLLSSPATFAANASGAAWVAIRPMLQLGTASLYSALPLPGRQHAVQAAAEAGAALAAMRQSWLDAAHLGWHSFKTETSLYQAGAGQELAERVGIHGEVVRNIAERRGWGQPDDALLDTVTRVGEFVRLPGRLLLGTDEFAKHLAIRGEVASNAVKRAAREGVDVTDSAALQQFIREEASKAFDFSKAELWEKYKVDSVYSLETGIMAEADRATFQEVNGFASKVSGVLAQAPYLRPFIPFVRTPLNILKQGFVDGTGLGALMNASKAASSEGFNPTRTLLAIQKQLLEDPGESFRVAGQIGVTTGLAAAFYGMAMDGTIVGGGPGRWSGGGRGSNEQRAWLRMMDSQGKAPYSINIGGYSIPFDRFGEPVAIVLRMAADMGMYSSWVEQTAQEEWMAGLAGIMASGLYQASFLKGINDVVDLITDPQAFSTRGGRAVQNYVSAFTPFGGLLNYVDKVDDPYKAVYDGASFDEVMRVHEDTFGTGIFAKIADRFPGYGGHPTLIDQLTGQPVPAYPGGGPSGLNPLQMAVPFLPRGHKQGDKVWEAVYKIKGSYRELTPTNVKLTAAEQQKLNAEMAKVAVGGRTVAQRIMDFYNRADVQTYVNNRGAAFTSVRTKIETELDSILREHHQLALRNLRARTPALEQRFQLNDGMRDAAAASDFRRAQEFKQRMDELFREAKLRGVF